MKSIVVIYDSCNLIVLFRANLGVCLDNYATLGSNLILNNNKNILYIFYIYKIYSSLLND